MRLRYLGYACINNTLGQTTGRSLRLARLNETTARGVIAKNLAGLRAILQWNVAEDLRFFRVSSGLIPFGSHEAFPFDWEIAFAGELAEIRAFVAENRLRLSIHPGQYTVLNSPNEDVVTRAIADLEYHARLMHALDPAQGTMTLHVGGAYGDKPAALERFADRFERLSPLARQRLILENDDTTFHVEEVLGLCRRLGVPLVFDAFHHQCNPPHADAREQLPEYLEAVVETWQGRIPKMHLSSRREGTRTSHADYIDPEDFLSFTETMARVGADTPYDLMLEAKEKELAVLQARQIVATMA